VHGYRRLARQITTLLRERKKRDHRIWLKFSLKAIIPFDTLTSSEVKIFFSYYAFRQYGTHLSDP